MQNTRNEFKKLNEIMANITESSKLGKLTNTLQSKDIKKTIYEQFKISSEKQGQLARLNEASNLFKTVVMSEQGRALTKQHRENSLKNLVFIQLLHWNRWENLSKSHRRGYKIQYAMRWLTCIVSG